MDWKEHIDKFWMGLLIGIFFPMFLFFCFWLFKYSYISFPERFIKYLMNGDLLGNTIKLCALPNLLLFYLFMNKNMNKATKGIIASVFVYLALVIYVMIYIEGGEIDIF